MKITSFDRKTLELLKSELQTAVDTVTKKMGLESIKVGNMSYTPENATIKLEAVIAGGKTRKEENTSGFRSEHIDFMNKKQLKLLAKMYLETL